MIGRLFATPLALLILTGGFLKAQEPPEFQKNLPTVLVWAEEGKDAELPCNITTLATDRINMILWFKDDTAIPLYTVDGRYGTLDQSHTALGSDLGRRSYFNRGPPGRLRISRVSKKDQGLFRCRVDFQNTPSRNFRVNLTLITPPEEPQILSSDGGYELRHIAGPYMIGNDVHLLCIVYGGIPRPRVTWWLDNNMLASGFEDSGTDTQISRLHLGSVTADFHGRKLSCKAKCIESSTPVSTSLIFFIYLKPSKVTILTPEDEFISAGRVKQIVCEAYDSNPAANISWLLESQPLTHETVTEVYEGNKTRSFLGFRPTPEDDGKELTCQATNAKYPKEHVEARMILNVAYPAIAEVKLKTSTFHPQINEGETVMLNCDIQSNPAPESIMWYHGSELLTETTTDLHLGPVTAAHEGMYTCFVRNSEGSARSKPYNLKIRYSPFCKPGTEEKSIGAIMHMTVNANCEIMSDSETDIRFSWTFNRSREVIAVASTTVQSYGRSSQVTYTIESEDDFGTLACWAANSVGHQKEPCVVHIFQAKLPTTPTDCSLQNRTRERQEVICKPGDDGGLHQQFMLKVVAEGESEPYFKLLSVEPRFRLRGLQPDKKYNLYIYSKNGVGTSSPPAVIENVLGPAATEKLTGNVEEEKPKHFWTIVITVGSTVFILCLAGLFIFCCRKKKTKEAIPLNNLGPSIRVRFPHDNGTDIYTD